MSPIVALGFVPFSLLLLGYAWRRRPPKHRLVMSLAFIGDVSLVLWLEFMRDATGTAAEAAGDAGAHALLVSHIAAALVCLAMYVMQMWTGNALFKTHGRVLDDAQAARRAKTLRKHIAASMLLLVTRLYVLVTSFWVVGTPTA